MQAVTKNSDVPIVFRNALAKQQLHKKLESCAMLDYPCECLVVAPTAVGEALNMAELGSRKITRWLYVVNREAFVPFTAAAVKESDPTATWPDRTPTLEAVLENHEENDGKLITFARRLLVLTDEERFRCLVPAYGAPRGSELPEFAPRRRGYVRELGGKSRYEDPGDSGVHACIIQMALKAIGPCGAAHRYSTELTPFDDPFPLCPVFSTERFMPRFWIGDGDPQHTLTSRYFDECARVVRDEYENWLACEPSALGEDNPVLTWLIAPTEQCRLKALNFALRHTVDWEKRRRHKILVGESEVKTIEGRPHDQPQLPTSNRRGPKARTDPVADRRIAEAWKLRNHRTFDDLAKGLGLTTVEVKRAVDRHRKRTKS